MRANVALPMTKKSNLKEQNIEQSLNNLLKWR